MREAVNILRGTGVGLDSSTAEIPRRSPMEGVGNLKTLFSQGWEGPGRQPVFLGQAIISLHLLCSIFYSFSSSRNYTVARHVTLARKL